MRSNLVIFVLYLIIFGEDIKEVVGWVAQFW